MQSASVQRVKNGREHAGIIGSHYSEVEGEIRADQMDGWITDYVMEEAPGRRFV